MVGARSANDALENLYFASLLHFCLALASFVRFCVSVKRH